MLGTSVHAFFTRAHLMSAVTWQQKIDAATDLHEIVEATKDYVSALDHRDIGRLPLHCLPGKFFDANDVSAYALILARTPATGDHETDELIRRLSGFFSDASIRLAYILANTSSNPEEQRTA